MKNSVPMLTNALGVYGKQINVKSSKIGGLYLVECKALNPHVNPKHGESTYLTVVDKDGYAVSGVKSNGIANWSQRLVDGKFKNSHIVVTDEYPQEKRYELILALKTEYGVSMKVRFEKVNTGTWNKHVTNAIDI